MVVQGAMREDKRVEAVGVGFAFRANYLKLQVQIGKKTNQTITKRACLVADASLQTRELYLCVCYLGRWSAPRTAATRASLLQELPPAFPTRADSPPDAPRDL